MLRQGPGVNLRGALLSLVVVVVAGGLPCQARPAQAALFEGGEGLDYFRRCAQSLEGRLEVVGDPRISDRVRVRLLEGDPPEVSNANLPYDQLIAKGHLLPLDAALNGPNGDGSGRWRDDFLPGSLDRFTRGGHVYGVPLLYTVQSIYYSRKHFREMGWSPPRSWTEWEALCRQAEAHGEAAVAFQGRYTYYLTPLLAHVYFHLAGREAFLRQQRALPGSFDNPEMVRTLQMVQTLAREHFQPGSAGMSHTEAQLEFLSGRAAMLLCGSWFKSEMRDKIPPGFELAECALPLPEARSAEPRAVQAGAGYLFVFQASPQPAVGIEYLRCLTAPSRVAELVEAQDLPVAIRGANSRLSPDLAGLHDLLSSSTSSFGEGMVPGPQGMAQLWADARDDLLSSRRTPPEIARALERGARALGQEPAWSWPGIALLAGLLLFAVAVQPRAATRQESPRARLPLADLAWLALPPLLVYGLFFLGPSLAAFAAAGSEWDGLSAPHWAGVDAFRRLLADAVFWQALGNNLFLLACIPAALTLWSLLFGALLQDDRRTDRWLRALFFIPSLLGVASILVWQALLHPDGPVNRLLTPFGFAHYPWLAQTHLFSSLIPIAVWSSGGFQLILTCAAITGVPGELLDAARLEGANRWQSFWAVTWPHIRPQVLAGYLLLLIGTAKAFETVWLLTNQEPASGNHVLGTLLMQRAFTDLQLGQAAALAVVMLLLIVAMRSLLARWSDES